MEKLSLVIPVINEGDNVNTLYHQITTAMTGLEYEVIFIDDGSTDNTLAKLKSIDDHRVHLIEFQKNFGQSSALQAGFDYASGDYIVTLDGDLQNDPNDIPMMVRMATEGDYDLVAGIRENRQDKLFIRRIPSMIANRLISGVSSVEIKDNGCTLKVFRADMAKSLNLYGEWHRFISVLAAFKGAKIAQVNVIHHPRIHGKSKYGISRTLRVLSDLIFLIFMKHYGQKPMHFFGNWGLIIFGTGILINIYMLILKLRGNDIWGKPLLLLGILLVLLGFQLIAFGVIFELMIRTQQKRHFSIRNVFVGGKKK